MRVCAFLILALLSACGETATSDILRVLVWPIPVPSFDGPPEDRSARARWDDGSARPPQGPAVALTMGSRRAVARLVSVQGERRTWRSSGGVVVVTEGARIVATSGLYDVLATTRFEGPDPLDNPRALLTREGRARRIVDLMGSDREPARMRFGLILDCTLQAREEGGALLVDEECEGAASFANRFFANPETGAVFRAEQWVGDRVAMLEIEFLNPSAN
ncbi:YjbF family lipoprotein [Plastoroseomonas arctica]|uniref:YjbF family lipoprotein n=1 Tax=Plastoroseomonas arctica TaxID=1509237 RepID=A0AAF1K442_9PROT|nr:YjbF family lipoprotein [Plastoroseomonas arctica]MBR0656373.1 YjbF family lipoprotein [Plastoroseomonas arctica]